MKGLVSAEQLDGQYNQTDIICSSVSFRPSLYSFNSSFVLIFYWYKGYVTVNMSLYISTTVCKPVLIHSDQIHPLCSSHSETFNHEQCDFYLKNVTKQTGVLLTFDNSDYDLKVKATILEAKRTILIFQALHGYSLHILLGQHAITSTKGGMYGVDYSGDICENVKVGDTQECTKPRKYTENWHLPENLTNIKASRFSWSPSVFLIPVHLLMLLGLTNTPFTCPCNNKYLFLFCIMESLSVPNQ